MNIIQKEHKFKCLKHQTRKDDFLVINRIDFGIISACSSCALSQNQQMNHLILLQDAIDADNNRIIANWPLLKDNSLILKYQDIQDQLQIQNSQQNLQNLKPHLIQKLETLENSLVEISMGQTHTAFINQYNEVSNKLELQNLLIENDQINDQITNFIQKIGYNQDNNQQIIQQSINQFENQSSAFQTSNYDSFFGEVFKAIDAFQQEGFINNHFFFQKFNVQNVNDSIKSIIIKDIPQSLLNLSDSIQQDLKEKKTQNLSTFKKQFGDLINSLQLQIDQFYRGNSNLQLQIKQSLKNNQVSQFVNVVNNSVFCTKVNAVGFIDIPITIDYLNQSFMVKIKKQVRWVGIGIIEKEKLLMNGQSFQHVSATTSCWNMFSYNGYSWSMNPIKLYHPNNMPYKEGDILQISILENQIKLTILTQDLKETFIDYTQSIYKTYCIGFRLDSPQDELEFI